MNRIVLPSERSGNSSQRDPYVFTSRVRLARNVDAFVFPAGLTLDRKQKLEDSFASLLKDIYQDSLFQGNLGEISEEEVRLLEANLVITSTFSQYGGLFFADPSGSWVLLPNEKDHIRLFSIEYGSSLTKMYRRLNDVLIKLEPHIHFAFDPTFGYLTSYADDAGAGLSLCYLINLTGVEMTGQIDSIAEVCEETGYRLTPYTGVRGSQLFLLRNLSSFGADESTLILNFEEFSSKIFKAEQEAREKLFSNKEDLDFLNAQLLDAAQSQSLTYHSMIEAIALADILDGVSFSISKKDTWREHIFSLHPHSNVFHKILQTEEIERLRADIFRKAFKKYIRNK
ncbi:MAG: hypothetical protein ACRCY4_00185 [Brevinema sp.]